MEEFKSTGNEFLDILKMKKELAKEQPCYKCKFFVHKKYYSFGICRKLYEKYHYSGKKYEERQFWLQYKIKNPEYTTCELFQEKSRNNRRNNNEKNN